MDPTEVINFEPLMKWMVLRHNVYLRRAEGQPAPWTDDVILQNYKFTNVRRELDRVSVALLEVLKKNEGAPLDEVLFNIVAFRMFNLPHVYRAIAGPQEWITRWNPRKVTQKLDALQDAGYQIFTGAYMMNAVGADGQRKHSMYVHRLSQMKTDRRMLLHHIQRENTIKNAVRLFAEYRNIGQFIAYEFATDLTYTPILENASDMYTWANPGPGAKRGLNRLLERPVKQRMIVDEAVEHMQILHHKCSRACDPSFWGRPLTMRDIEHSLCEFDKYERVRLGEGRPRSKYKATGE